MSEKKYDTGTGVTVGIKQVGSSKYANIYITSIPDTPLRKSSEPIASVKVALEWAKKLGQRFNLNAIKNMDDWNALDKNKKDKLLYAMSSMDTIYASMKGAKPGNFDIDTYPTENTKSKLKESLRPIIKEILAEIKNPIKETDTTKPLFSAPTLDGNTFVVVPSGRIKDGEDGFKMLVIDKNKNTVKDWGTHPMLKGAIQMAKNKKIIESTIIKEAKGLNLSQPWSNLHIKGWGKDRNGNMAILVGFPNDKGWAIQTNQNLPNTHSILTNNPPKLTPNDLDAIGEEITDYVDEHGGNGQKSRLKRY